MKDPREIILKPLLTEKINAAVSAQNVYSFKVIRGATKSQIKSSIEELFKVHVLEVRTINYLGKPKKRGRNTGFRPSWKKAMVKLASGEKIAVFEGL